MKKIILGIDPGTNILGFSVIVAADTRLSLVEVDVLRMKKGSSHHERLKEIYFGIQQVIREYKPGELAIEAPFFGKNVQSMLKLGRAQGVAITIALSHEIPVFEYSPRKIKQSITGNGNASKEQVAAILSQLLQFDSKHLSLDATDSLGVAVCHHFQRRTLNTTRGYGWRKFIAEHPERLIQGQQI